jgi:malonyl-CoA/methylmalonyl-CoA synthetase
MDRSPLLQRFDELSHSSAIAVRDGLGAVSFASLAVAARALATRLRNDGLAGQRIALLAPQDRSWLEGFWGVLLAGGTVVPLSPLHPPREQQFFFRESRAAALLVAEPLALELAGSRQLPYRASVDGARDATADSDERRAASEPPRPDAERASALILYTSGTTGKPKGVLISHRNVLEGARTLHEAWEITSSDRVLHTLPLHHVHGICVSLLCAFLAGASTEMLPRYEPERVLEAAARSSVLMGVPTQHVRLVQHLETLPDGTERQRLLQHLRSQRLITSGSAALPETLGRRLEALSGQYPLERYGMTEVGIVIGNPLAGPRLPGSCGRPLPRCQIRIVSDGGDDVEQGQPGEIWIAAPTVFEGYDGDEAATRAAFGAGGFFKSGDTAVWTSDGYVKILGRTSVDIIKSGGYKLSALELEEHLREHPWVGDVAVLGIPDDIWGESALAVVVPSTRMPAQDEALAGEQLRAWMRERVAGYKVPKRVLLRADLPRNAMGKVQKPALLAQLRDAAMPGDRP